MRLNIEILDIWYSWVACLRTLLVMLILYRDHVDGRNFPVGRLLSNWNDVALILGGEWISFLARRSHTKILSCWSSPGENRTSWSQRIASAAVRTSSCRRRFHGWPSEGYAICDLPLECVTIIGSIEATSWSLWIFRIWRCHSSMLTASGWRLWLNWHNFFISLGVKSIAAVSHLSIRPRLKCAQLIRSRTHRMRPCNNNFSSQSLRRNGQNIVLVEALSSLFSCLTLQSDIIPLMGASKTRHRTWVNKVDSAWCCIFQHRITFIYLLLTGVFPLLVSIKQILLKRWDVLLTRLDAVQ